MDHPEYKKNQIYHYTSTDAAKSANAAFLICAFSVIIYSMIDRSARFKRGSCILAI